MKKHIFSSLLWIFSLILTACAIRYLPDMVSVSANATGMELPVTSVERSDSRLSLTFSAAGNCLELSNLLEILDSHQVKAPSSSQAPGQTGIQTRPLRSPKLDIS